MLDIKKMTKQLLIEGEWTTEEEIKSIGDRPFSSLNITAFIMPFINSKSMSLKIKERNIFRLMALINGMCNPAIYNANYKISGLSEQNIFKSETNNEYIRVTYNDMTFVSKEGDIDSIELDIENNEKLLKIFGITDHSNGQYTVNNCKEIFDFDFDNTIGYKVSKLKLNITWGKVKENPFKDGVPEIIQRPEIESIKFYKIACSNKRDKYKSIKINLNDSTADVYKKAYILDDVYEILSVTPLAFMTKPDYEMLNYELKFTCKDNKIIGIDIDFNTDCKSYMLDKTILVYENGKAQSLRSLVTMARFTGIKRLRLKGMTIFFKDESVRIIANLSDSVLDTCGSISEQ